MTQAEFSNTLRKLFNLDHSDVPFLSATQWPKFRDDPVRFFIKADDETLDRLWTRLQATRAGGFQSIGDIVPRIVERVRANQEDRS
jgi:hypothetical protein